MTGSSPPVRPVVLLVAARLDLPLSRVLGPERTERLARARFAAVWVARTALGASWRRIGAQLGRRDHSTVIHAYRRAEVLRGADAGFLDLTDRLLAAVQDREPADA